MPEQIAKNAAQELKVNAADGTFFEKYALEEVTPGIFEKDIDTPVMRTVVNKLVEQHEGICGIFVGDDEVGYNFIIGSKTVDCREVATKLRNELNARGGGKAPMIQGSVVVDKDRIVKTLNV